MKIHWTGFQQLQPAANARIEARLRQLAQRQRDLIDVRILAGLSRPHEPGAQRVRIACRVRGRPIMARAAHKNLERALTDALDRLERGIHRIRARRRTLRRMPDSAPRSPAAVLQLHS